MLLSERITIYVPSHSADGWATEAMQKTWRDAWLVSLAEWFGGATAEAPAQGAYLDAKGQLQTETVVKVYAYATPKDLEAARDKIGSKMWHMMQAMKQESVAYEDRAGLHLILNDYKTRQAS